MKLELTTDQRELHAVAREAMADLAPLSLAREFLEGGGDAAALTASLGELGWYAVGLEDDFGVTGLCLLAERCGAQAAPTVLVDTAVAARLAAAVGRGGALVDAIAAGELPTALAVQEARSGWSLRGINATLRSGRDGLLLDGTKAGVQHACTVAAFAVIAEHDGEPAVAFVAAGAPGVTVTRSGGMDPASAPAVLQLDDVCPAATLTGDDPAAAIEAAFAVGAVAVAAEGVGAASRALDLAVSYAKEREQFGQLIGSFQGLKHVMATAHVDRESALASVLYAAASLDEGLPDAGEAVSIAKAHAARASRATVEAALQVLGGIAFTWEHDVHLLQRRVHSCERRFGDALVHERRLGDRLAARLPAVTA